MMVPSKSRLALIAAIGLMCGSPSVADDEAGNTVSPADNSTQQSGKIDVVATAPSGKLQLDGVSIEAERPFPEVFHATLKAAPGMHSLVLLWEGGKKEAHFFVGPNPPAGFQPFHQHPPLADVQCTQCHGLNRRERFVFKGGCFDSHRQESVSKVHTPEPSASDRWPV